MKRYFNTTGFCRPEKHYMIDPLRGLDAQIEQLIRQEQYFLIHAPRQSGKTTLLHALSHKLNSEGECVCVVLSVEQAGYKSITEEQANEKIIYSLYSQAVLTIENKEFHPINPKLFKGSVFQYLNEWALSSQKQIILLIDEVDSLYDDVLVSLLRQLRDGFQLRPKGFPSSIALVGLRDIREYKEKARDGKTTLGSGSPFNIKAESFKLPNFTKEQVKALYQQHTDDTGQVFQDDAVNLLYDYSGGHPWLVNALAYEIISRMLKNDYSKPVTAELAEQAKENLIVRRDTHLDSLLDKLQEERVKKIIIPLLNGEEVIYDNFNDDLQYCMDLGIVEKVDKKICFANKIYAEVIPRVLNQNFQDNIHEEGETKWYIQKDGSLDIDQLLKAFQQFYREHSAHWIDRFYYKEAGQQLLLMAFLQRVLNGGGRIEREMAIARGRTDMVVYYGKQRFIIEMKLKRQKTAKEKGLKQLYDYLDAYGEESGYLVLFETKPSSKVSWTKRIKWKVVNYKPDGQKVKKITVVEM